MKVLVLLLAILYTFPLMGQVKKHERGKIIDSVIESSTSTESFAMYLPNAYTSDSQSSIVFIFEPMGRGKVGIQPFVKASEKYNHILICSNNARNGPYDRNMQIADRLFRQVLSEFNVDPRRIYVAGFSGGARLASTIALVTGQMQGVIACGAGFSGNQLLYQNKLDFSYAAIVGDQDMNYIEMYKNKDYLKTLNISNELFVFEMNHKWPSQDQILSAFDWLELEAYRKGLIDLDPKKIKEYYTIFYENSRQSEERDQLLMARESYERTVKNFNTYFEVDSIVKKIDDLKSNPELKKEVKEFKKLMDEEVRLSQMFSERFSEDLKRKTADSDWWKTKIEGLKKELVKASDSRKKMLNRLLYKIYAMAIEKVSVGDGVKHINQSILCYDICLQVYPNYYFLYFKQMENYMNKNDDDMVMLYLKKMIDEGYSNMERIKNHKSFIKYSDDKRFLELLRLGVN